MRIKRLTCSDCIIIVFFRMPSQSVIYENISQAQSIGGGVGVGGGGILSFWTRKSVMFLICIYLCICACLYLYVFVLYNDDEHERIFGFRMKEQSYPCCVRELEFAPLAHAEAMSQHCWLTLFCLQRMLSFSHLDGAAFCYISHNDSNLCNLG